MLFIRHLATLLLSTYLVMTNQNNYKVIVPAGKIECYGFAITNGKYQSLEVHFQVISGGGLDITFSVRSPKGLHLINDLKQAVGTHRVDLNMASAGYGDYLFCFDNTFSIQSDKRVSFELYVFDAQGHFFEEFYKQISVETEVLRALNMRVDQFQNVTMNVKNNLNIIERLQKQYANIELADRRAIERSFEMINFWSILHLILMIFALYVQVYMVRSLFEDNARIGVILRKGRLNN